MTVDANLAVVDAGHDQCVGDFCVQTGKPGLCVGQHRTAVSQVQTPVLRTVPNAPADDTQQRAKAAQDAKVLNSALNNASTLAQQMPKGHQAVADFHAALGKHQAAAAAEVRAHDAAQKTHDTVQAQNAAANAHYQAKMTAAQARDAAYAHAQAVKAAHAKMVAAKAHHGKAKVKLGPPIKAATQAPPLTALAQLYAVPDESPARADPLAVFELYASTGAELYAVMSFEHQDCLEGQFCRNPLHPGPCKGWKHTLHTVAPGAYHAYEQARVAKLNEKRTAKIEALKKLGKPVPASLLKEITYAQTPKPPAGWTPPEVPGKEALNAIPTKAAIGAKLDAKHAAQAVEADHKLTNQAESVQAMAEHVFGFGKTDAQTKIMKAKLAKVQAEQGKEPITAHPMVASTVDKIVKEMHQQLPMKPAQKQAITEGINAHLEAGKPGLPDVVKDHMTTANAMKAAKDEELAKAVEKSAHQSSAKTHLEGYGQVKDWADATPKAREQADSKASEILASPHTTAEQKAEATKLKQAIEIGTKKAALQKTQQDILDKVEADYKKWSPKEQSIAVPILKDMIGSDSASDKQKAKAKQLIGELKSKPLDLSDVPGPEEEPKVSGALAHPDMMAAYDEIKYGGGSTGTKLVALEKSGVTKEELAKLSPAGQKTIKDFLDEASKDSLYGGAPKGLQQKLGLSPGGGSANGPTAGVTPAQMTAAHSAAKGLAGLGPLANSDSVQKIYAGEGASSYTPDKMIEDASQGLGTSIATIHGAHHQNAYYTPHEQEAVTKAIKAEVKHMITHGQTEPPVNGVIHAAQYFNKMNGVPQTDAMEAKKAKYLKMATNNVNVNGLVEAGAGHNAKPASGADQVAKNVVGHQGVLKAMGMGTGSPNVATEELYQQAAHSGASDAVIHQQGTTLAAVLLHNKLPAGFAEKTPAHQQLMDVLASDASEMIKYGDTSPPDGSPWAAVWKAIKGQDPFASYAKDKLAQDLEDWMVDADMVHGAVSTPSGGAGAGGASTGALASLGSGNSIAGFSKSTKVKILGAFKSSSHGAQLSAGPAANFDNLLDVAHAYAGKPGTKSLSLAQVMKMIDEQHTHNLGVTNTNELEKMVTNWLATPAGKQYALNAQPNPEHLAELTGGEHKPVGLKKGQKVAILPGPGGYDQSKTHFPKVSESHAQEIQDKQKPLTPAQKQALYAYGQGSASINDYLRGEDEAAADATKNAIHQIQSSMSPLPQDMLLTRGTGFFGPFKNLGAIQAMVGKTFQEKAFLSTSVVHGMSGSVRFMIEAPAGTPAVYMQKYTPDIFYGEAEMLLAAGTKLKIIEVTGTASNIVVRVRVVS